MKTYLPKLIFIFFLTALLLLPLTDCLAEGEDITASMIGGISSINLPSGGEAQALKVTGLAINAFLSFLGVVFLCLMVYGGYKWMMASGREEEVKKSQEIIRAAIIGLTIVIASYAISYFVTSSLQGAIGQ